MKTFTQFIAEKYLNESVVFLSKPLEQTLSRMGDDPIAKELLNLIGQKIANDITLLDLSKTDGFLTFSTLQKTKEFLNRIDSPDMKELSAELDLLNTNLSPNIRDSKYPQTKDQLDQLYTSEHPLWDWARSEGRIGRVINRLFPNKFTQAQIETFVNRFKSVSSGSDQSIQVIKGDEISMWYNQVNYLEIKHTLGSSCMKEKSEDFFEIYTKNPEVCSLVCIFENDSTGNKKVSARALVWKIQVGKAVEISDNLDDPFINNFSDSDLDFEYFMDRQYGISDTHIEKLRNWATEQGWAYKHQNTPMDYSSLVFGGKAWNCAMKVNIKGKCKLYPYMDTFKTLDTKDLILYNAIIDEAGNFGLNGTSGLPEVYQGTPQGARTAERSEDCRPNQYWSSHERLCINRDAAVWSDHLNTHLTWSRAVEVRVGVGQGWYPQEYCDREDVEYGIVWSDTENSWLRATGAVWSESEETFLLGTNAIWVITGLSLVTEYQDGKPIEKYSIQTDWVRNQNRDVLTLDSAPFWLKMIIQSGEYLTDHPIDLNEPIRFLNIDKGAYRPFYGATLIPICLVCHGFEIKGEDYVLGVIEAALLDKDFVAEFIGGGTKKVRTDKITNYYLPWKAGELDKLIEVLSGDWQQIFDKLGTVRHGMSNRQELLLNLGAIKRAAELHRNLFTKIRNQN